MTVEYSMLMKTPVSIQLRLMELMKFNFQQDSFPEMKMFLVSALKEKT
ncbi:hypothetical protein SDC9_115919 [bioreactor metagenome]|uniref:Uncharacterized protein n=1 Tax=bioreactor metagenome TaxID=1076179 RepID=A0A645BUQ3_9ZZZZ